MGANVNVQPREIILVLCHSFFHNAFRLQRPVDGVKFKIWTSSRFIANLIIERQAELPEGCIFAVTSKQVFESFSQKFLGDKPSDKLIEAVEILRNSLTIAQGSAISNLSIDDSVFVICDTLFSRSTYEPVLVSDIPKKEEKAKEFYQKKDPNVVIPYHIYTVVEVEVFLRGSFQDLSAIVDERMKMGDVSSQQARFHK
jgi:hypothetical protein